MDESAALSTLRKGKSLAAKIAGSDEKIPAFVGVYPLDFSKTESRRFLRNHGFDIIPETGTAYHVRRFSVEQKLITDDVSMCETDLHEKVSKIAFSETELVDALSEFGVALDSLDLPFKSDYPI